MSKARSETIVLRGEPIRKEGQASGVIRPGHIIEFGGANELRVRSVAGTAARKAFALENDSVGGLITDAYALGQNVLYGVFSDGDEVMARVAAEAAAITKGAALTPDATGCLRNAAAGENVVAYAMEAVDNSSNDQSEAFIMVEIGSGYVTDANAAAIAALDVRVTALENA